MKKTKFQKIQSIFQGDILKDGARTAPHFIFFFMI